MRQMFSHCIQFKNEVRRYVDKTLSPAVITTWESFKVKLVVPLFWPWDREILTHRGVCIITTENIIRILLRVAADKMTKGI